MVGSGDSGAARRLQRYRRELTRVFQTASSKQEAHARSRPILEDIASDRAFFTQVLRQYLSTPGVLNANNYPTVGMNIALTPDYHLLINCWIPLPDGQTNISSKAVHHHGEMLLTTMTLFGPGYDHWLFTQPTELDAQRELYTMDLVERKRHALHEIAFVDAWKAHLPVYPERLSITLCLWSSQHPTTWRDRVKRIPLLKQHERWLREWAKQMGFARSLDLKVIRYFDFYPTPEGFKGMRDRIEFPLGPNEDHLCSVFHTLQETQNDALVPLIEGQLEAGTPFTNAPLIQRLAQQLHSGHRIEGRVSACHLGIPHTWFTTEALEQTLMALRARSQPSPVVHAG